MYISGWFKSIKYPTIEPRYYDDYLWLWLLLQVYTPPEETWTIPSHCITVAIVISALSLLVFNSTKGILHINLHNHAYNRHNRSVQ